MGENENMEKDIQNIEAETEKGEISDTKIDELDCDNLSYVSGGQLIGKKISIANLVTAYGFQDPRDHISLPDYDFPRPDPIIMEKYGFPKPRKSDYLSQEKKLEDELKNPNLSEEERNLIKTQLDGIITRLGLLSDGIKQ